MTGCTFERRPSFVIAIGHNTGRNSDRGGLQIEPERASRGTESFQLFSRRRLRVDEVQFNTKTIEKLEGIRRCLWCQECGTDLTSSRIFMSRT